MTTDPNNLVSYIKMTPSQTNKQKEERHEGPIRKKTLKTNQRVRVRVRVKGRQRGPTRSNEKGSMRKNKKMTREKSEIKWQLKGRNEGPIRNEK